MSVLRVWNPRRL